MAYRWWTLLAPVGRPEGRHYEYAVGSADLQVGRRPPLATVMRIFFVSTFVGTFLPASVGGDAGPALRERQTLVGTGEGNRL